MCASHKDLFNFTTVHDEIAPNYFKRSRMPSFTMIGWKMAESIIFRSISNEQSTNQINNSNKRCNKRYAVSVVISVIAQCILHAFSPCYDCLHVSQPNCAAIILVHRGIWDTGRLYWFLVDCTQWGSSVLVSRLRILVAFSLVLRSNSRLWPRRTKQLLLYGISEPRWKELTC